MKRASILRRWTVQSIHSMILGAALVGPAGKVLAQSPQATVNRPSSCNYSRSLSFDLPVSIDTETRSTLSEIQLYMKTPTGSWKMQDSGSQFLTRFSCRVQKDGEYWYSLVMVDRTGRKTPADISLAAPMQRIIVDTTPPVIQVQPVNGPNGEYCLRCTVQDGNLDPLTVRAVCRTDVGEVPLEMIPNNPGMFRVRGSEVMRFPVIVSAVDMAKNVGTREVNVRELINAGLSPDLAPVRQGREIVPTGVPDNMLPQPNRTDKMVANHPSSGSSLDPMQRSDRPVVPELPEQRSDKTIIPELPYQRLDLPKLAPSNSTTGGTGGPSPITTNGEYQIRPKELPLDSQFRPKELPLDSQFRPKELPLDSQFRPKELPLDSQFRPKELPLDSQSRVAGPYQLINTRQASVEYRIDQVGTSGVGRVEVYMTPDQGQTWHRIGEDPDRRSPAEISLPGDGVFGIRIAISNGNGFGGRPPVRGDVPHCTIEVDSTAPFVQLRSAELLPGNGEVEIRWNATDKNLGSAPINLFYRTSPDASWQVLARNVKNDGMYRWAFPRESSSQFLFKIEVTDQASNVAQDVSRQPILIDTSEPRATVIGVTGAGTNLVRPATGGN